MNVHLRFGRSLNCARVVPTSATYLCTAGSWTTPYFSRSLTLMSSPICRSSSSVMVRSSTFFLASSPFLRIDPNCAYAGTANAVISSTAIIVRRISNLPLPIPQDFVHEHALGAALDVHFANRPRRHRYRQLRPGRFADQDVRAVLLVQRFEPRPKVHRVADDRVAHDRLGSDVAGDHLAGVDADADVHRWQAGHLPARVEPVEFGQHLESAPDRVVGVPGVLERGAKQPHHHVTDELIERTVVPEQDPDHGAKVFIQLGYDRLGPPFFRGVGEAANVGKEDRHFTPLPT